MEKLSSFEILIELRETLNIMTPMIYRSGANDKRIRESVLQLPNAAHVVPPSHPRLMQHTARNLIRRYKSVAIPDVFEDPNISESKSEWEQIHIGENVMPLCL